MDSTNEYIVFEIAFKNNVNSLYGKYLFYYISLNSGLIYPALVHVQIIRKEVLKELKYIERFKFLFMSVMELENDYNKIRVIPVDLFFQKVNPRIGGYIDSTQNRKRAYSTNKKRLTKRYIHDKNTNKIYYRNVVKNKRRE